MQHKTAWAWTLPYAPRPRVARTPWLLASVLLLFSSGITAVAQAPDAAGRVSLETLSPSAVDGAEDLGPIQNSTLIELTLTLTPPSSRRSALDQFLADLQTPGSPNYRKWITPTEFATSYGSTADELAEVTAWVQSDGLVVVGRSPGGTRITVAGLPAQVQAAFGISLHAYWLNGRTYFANATEPSLPTPISTLITSIEGLDNLPVDLEAEAKGPGTTPCTLVNGKPAALTVAALAPFIDQDVTPLLTLDAACTTGTFSNARFRAYEALFRQAAAEGISTLLIRNAAAHEFPGTLPEITSVASPGDTPDTQTPLFARPTWQSVPGLPADPFRHAPDLAASSVTALASTLTSIAASLPGGRLGNINPILYQIGPVAGLYTQPDEVEGGTWEAATGLGLVNLEKLARAFPRGSSPSFASLSLSSYAVTYGTPVTFTSNVTSGNGGTVPSGTVTFALGGGINLTAPVTAGTASYTITPAQLDAGTYPVQASYSGDGAYASSGSASGQLYIGPEASVLSALVSTGATLGSTYSVSVTDTSTNGAGQPGGNITLLVEGTQTSLSQALTAGAGASASTTFEVPANTVGTLTLGINCTTTTDFTCYNPYTTRVTVAKGTPGIAISHTPSLPVAGQAITLNATMTGAGSGPTPTGSVTFYDGATVLNSANLAANGTVTETGTLPNTPTHTITATYNGDASYTPVSTSGSTIARISTTTALAIFPAVPQVGQAVQLSATVTPAGASTVPISGQVVFYNGTTQIGFGTVSGGVAIATVSFASPSMANITAVYSGDANYLPSTSAPLVLAATLTPVTVTLTVATASGLAGSNILLNVVVAGTVPTSTAPTGVVSFYLAGPVPILLATMPLTPGATGAPSVAQLNLTSLPAGLHSIDAVYSGDSSFAQGTSASVAVGSSDYAVVFTPPNITLRQGATGTVTLEVNATQGFEGTIAIACIPPAGSLITCSLSQGSLAGGGTSALTINTVATPSAENRFPGFGTAGGLSLAALLFSLVRGRDRRRLPGLLFLLFTLVVCLQLSGCGASTVGSRVSGGTPLGTVLLTIDTAASNGTTSIAHDYTFAVSIVP